MGLAVYLSQSGLLHAAPEPDPGDRHIVDILPGQNPWEVLHTCEEIYGKKATCADNYLEEEAKLLDELDEELINFFSY